MLLWIDHIVKVGAILTYWWDIHIIINIDECHLQLSDICD